MDIPGQVVIRIAENSIPQGPQGASAYQVWLSNGHTGTEADFLNWLRSGQVTAGSVKVAHSSLPAIPTIFTGSQNYAPTGLSCSINVTAGERVLVDVRGIASHSDQSIVHFTLRRNGVDLTPANHSGLAAIRTESADNARTLCFQFDDAPPAGNVTYELMWKCHSAPYASIGKRFSDAAMAVPTTMTLMAHT